MPWAVRLDQEFASEVADYPRAVQKEIAAIAQLLQQFGPQLQRPYCDTLKGSSFANMKELRFSVADGAWRIAFAFDPNRQAILLVGGSKSGVNERLFYRNLIRVADTRYRAHVMSLPNTAGDL